MGDQIKRLSGVVTTPSTVTVPSGVTWVIRGVAVNTASSASGDQQNVGVQNGGAVFWQRGGTGAQYNIAAGMSGGYMGYASAYIDTFVVALPGDVFSCTATYWMLFGVEVT